MKWIKRKLSDEAYESASACDINNDGIIDIVCGAYWYEGPDFTEKHKICDIEYDGNYYDDFSNIPMDVTGNGYPDIITGGWGRETLYMRKNPGNTADEWECEDIDRCTNIETTRFYDIDCDGDFEILPNTPNGPLVCYKLMRDEDGKPLGKFSKYVLYSSPIGHGMGIGDINGDGKPEIVCIKGYLTMPEDGAFAGEWTLHEEFAVPENCASVPMLIADVTGNGLMDVVYGRDHAFAVYEAFEFVHE